MLYEYFSQKIIFAGFSFKTKARSYNLYIAVIIRAPGCRPVVDLTFDNDIHRSQNTYKRRRVLKLDKTSPQRCIGKMKWVKNQYKKYKKHKMFKAISVPKVYL